MSNHHGDDQPAASLADTELGLTFERASGTKPVCVADLIVRYVGREAS